MCACDWFYADPSLSPSSLKVTEIAALTAVVSWVPASSNLEHAVSVDGDVPTIIRRTCFVCHIAGSSPIFRTFLAYPILFFK